MSHQQKYKVSKISNSLVLLSYRSSYNKRIWQEKVTSRQKKYKINQLHLFSLLVGGPTLIHKTTQFYSKNTKLHTHYHTHLKSSIDKSSNACQFIAFFLTKSKFLVWRTTFETAQDREDKSVQVGESWKFGLSRHFLKQPASFEQETQLFL